VLSVKLCIRLAQYHKARSNWNFTTVYWTISIRRQLFLL